MLSVRAALPADAIGVARVHVRSWQVGYRGLIPDAYLDALRPEDRVARYTFGAEPTTLPFTIIAENEGVICGFATTGACRVDDALECGELLALYVDPDAWGRGIGRRLIAEARSNLLTRGYNEAVLWLLVGNERSEAFYRQDGWVPDGAAQSEELWGARVRERRFRRRLV